MESLCFCDCKYSLSQLNSFFNSGDYKIIVARSDKVLCAYLIIHISDKIDIEKIYVDPNYRKQNIGTKLLNEIDKLNLNRKIILEVNENNTTAINFYKKNGFKQISIRKNYYKNGDNAIILEK